MFFKTFYNMSVLVLQIVMTVTNCNVILYQHSDNFYFIRNSIFLLLSTPVAFLNEQLIPRGGNGNALLREKWFKNPFKPENP